MAKYGFAYGVAECLRSFLCTLSIGLVLLSESPTARSSWLYCSLCAIAAQCKSTCVISKVLNMVRFLFKNEFIFQNTFTGLQCNLHCGLSQRSNVWAKNKSAGFVCCSYMWK